MLCSISFTVSTGDGPVACMQRAALHIHICIASCAFEAAAAAVMLLLLSDTFYISTFYISTSVKLTSLTLTRICECYIAVIKTSQHFEPPIGMCNTAPRPELYPAFLRLILDFRSWHVSLSAPLVFFHFVTVIVIVTESATSPERHSWMPGGAHPH